MNKEVADHGKSNSAHYMQAIFLSHLYYGVGMYYMVQHSAFSSIIVPLAVYLVTKRWNQ